MQVAIDYQKRIENIQTLLQERGIDALFGTRLKTVTHVSGAFCPWRSATVVPAKGKPQVLTLMMGSPVITGPELAKVPEALLANVSVFRNGLRGRGPLGFQPDIFDSLPGSQGYRPLRRVSMVAWKQPASARELRSVEELMQAQSKGDVSIERTDVVVNMPMLMWPLGRR